MFIHLNFDWSTASFVFRNHPTFLGLIGPAGLSIYPSAFLLSIIYFFSTWPDRANRTCLFLSLFQSIYLLNFLVLWFVSVLKDNRGNNKKNLPPPPKTKKTLKMYHNCTFYLYYQLKDYFKKKYLIIYKKTFKNIVRIRNPQSENPEKKQEYTIHGFICYFFGRIANLRLCTPKDLANRWTDLVLLYRVASHRSWEGL